MLRSTRIFMILVCLLCGLSMLALAGKPPSGSIPMTVTATPDGISCTGIGACEGGDRFNIADFADLGITTFRIWGSSAESEPVDDDGVFGAPTIAQIKANPGIIPWAVWDANMKSTSFRGHGVSFYNMLLALKNAGIKPVVSLVNVNNGDQPAWMQQLNPPDSEADWNEWWEHVFATVYYLNVMNNLDVHNWQVLNEPDNAGQGWGGSLADYIIFTQKTHDAIKYVYDTYLPGKTFKLHVAQSVHANEWVQQSMMANDNIIDVYDWHNYGSGSSGEAVTVHGWMNQYDMDGQHEEFYCSEWGTYRESYDNYGNACGKWGGQLMKNSLNDAGHVEGSAIFSMYEWGTMDGLINDDGSKTAMYYVMRLLNRAINGGKPQYLINWMPADTNIAIASKDTATNTLYVTIRNAGTGVKAQVIDLNVSAFKTTGTVTFRRVAEGYPDVVTGTASLNNGHVIVDMPASAIVQVIIPL
ncbi:MAG: hypothetical protein ACM3X6_01330 [Patescibacteria group bacterium]